MWRSLAELEGSPQFAELQQREFPGGIPEGVSKRDFLKLMGASLALAGLVGCRRPEGHLVPFNKGVEWSVPGKFLYYATSMPTRLGAIPLVATTVDGRPTKLEGNPLHPASNGGTDSFAQASILDLYDPQRSKTFRENGTDSTPEAFDAWIESLVNSIPTGIAILAEQKHSPTRDRLRDEILAKHPGTIWCEYEPLGSPEFSFLPNFENADVVLALDSDFLNPIETGPHYADAFFKRRAPGAEMNRLYVVENHFTPTGGLADHRRRWKASRIGDFAQRLAACISGAAESDEWIRACAADLLAHKGRSLVLVGPRQPAWVQALGLQINSALGNTLTGFARQATTSLPDLCSAIEAGKVTTLFILGGNPAYNAPADLRFADVLKRVSTVARLGLYEDETSALSRWHIPAAHFLETWSDARSAEGTYTSVQPMILPLWNGVNELDILARLAGRPKSTGPDLIKETFASLAGNQSWTTFLREGFLPNSANPTAEISPAAAQEVENIPDELELVFLQSSSVDDGRYAANAWLQETPDFETKVTWDNVVLVSPATAKKLGIRSNNFGPLDAVAEKLGNRIDYDIVADVIEISAGGVSIHAAALVAPGHADDSLSIALGYGRKLGSTLFDGVGFNAYPLRLSTSPRFRTGVSVRVTGETYPLARTQEHQSMEGRDLFREGTLDRFEHEPNFARTMGMDGHIPPNVSLYTHPELTSPEQWGMTIDLNTCTGCNACVVACQAENNVPVVGKEQVRRNRDMAWIRIDRYFAGSPDDPEMLAQAVMCQHCENAPCETVCPVNATVHSEEGLNLMAYNRCIGTRYCANNCPWKVRRFNYFDYNQRSIEKLYWGPLAKKGMADSLKMSKNPNVTVRMRGVMEKCTFCIQRIEEAKIARLVKAGPRNKNEFPIAPFQSACQQACPAGSIVFGNINDPQSKVAQGRKDPRAYVTLKYLNTAPRVSYFARIRNPNPAMPGAALVGMANGAPDEHH
jgi:molybdopterin-containing oxidoreductase family iron-sulfur binding subunit